LNNTTGGWNTANGMNALISNTTGDFNTASGQGALGNNGIGGANTANGQGALASNTEGSWNTATGTDTMVFNTTGWLNTATGANALHNSTTGTLNIALGWAAGDSTTGNNNIMIGNIGASAESNAIRIGTQATVIDEFGVPHAAHRATFIAGISGTAMPGGTGVVIDANGRLGVKPSSKRFKDEIKPMDKVSEAILALKPVTFRYKKELDANGIPQFGLVAEDVAKVNPDLVVKDAEGKVYTVRYEAVNAMLLNEFLKEHRTVQELKKEIAALTATVQKVSEQVEMSRPASQVVNNP
jgi:trimeric autotransporter adhesin